MSHPTNSSLIMCPAVYETGSSEKVLLVPELAGDIAGSQIKCTNRVTKCLDGCILSLGGLLLLATMCVPLFLQIAQLCSSCSRLPTDWSTFLLSVIPVPALLGFYRFIGNMEPGGPTSSYIPTVPFLRCLSMLSPLSHLHGLSVETMGIPQKLFFLKASVNTKTDPQASPYHQYLTIDVTQLLSWEVTCTLCPTSLAVPPQFNF